MPGVLRRAVLVWLVIIAVETVHGVLRTLLLVPLLGDFPARRVSVLTGSLLIFGDAEQCKRRSRSVALAGVAGTS